MTEYVENKLKIITGLNKYVLNDKEKEEDLYILYNSLKAIDMLQEDKKNRNIDMRAKIISTEKRTFFLDEDVILEAQIREPFAKKAIELLKNYEENIAPKIVNFETYNQYYFDGINKVMEDMCELFYKFLLEFDVVDNDFKSIYEKYKEKWIDRDYRFLKPLYKKIDDVMFEAGMKVNKRFEYDETYEPNIYNGRGISNAINAKFQSEMIGIGINFVRMVGSNLGKYMAIEKVNNVISTVFKEIYLGVLTTSRFICSWMEDLLQDVISILRAKNIINLHKNVEWEIKHIDLYLSRQTWGTNVRIDPKKRDEIMEEIHRLYPFCLKAPNLEGSYYDNQHFIEHFELIKFLNIDYIFVANYNVISKVEIPRYMKEIQEQSDNWDDKQIGQYKEILSSYKLLETIEYNDSMKYEIKRFIKFLSKYLEPEEPRKIEKLNNSTLIVPKNKSDNKEKKSQTNNQKISQNMICPSCGKSIVYGYKFCNFCGASVTNLIKKVSNDKIICKSCGKEIMTKVKFCNFCGQSNNNFSESQ